MFDSYGLAYYRQAQESWLSSCPEAAVLSSCSDFEADATHNDFAHRAANPPGTKVG